MWDHTNNKKGTKTGNEPGWGSHDQPNLFILVSDNFVKSMYDYFFIWQFVILLHFQGFNHIELLLKYEHYLGFIVYSGSIFVNEKWTGVILFK